MEKFLSKIFKSKSKKQIYNVDESKKKKLKKVNKNVNQHLSSAYVTDKLRKEFGIYRPNSEFLMARYNMPCVMPMYQHSIESVDVIPLCYNQERRVDPDTCTQDLGSYEKKNVQYNDHINSNIETKVLDENKHTKVRVEDSSEHFLMNGLKGSNKKNEKALSKQYFEDPSFGDHGEKSVEISLVVNTNVRKDSHYGRYDDPCKKLNNSHQCTEEFIYEPKLKKCARTPDDFGFEKKEQWIHDNNNADSKKIKKKVTLELQKGSIEELQNQNTYSITKKGRIKCKLSEKEKVKEIYKKTIEDGEMSRRRNYHSMILLSRKGKTKEKLSNKIFESHKFMVSEISLDFLPYDKDLTMLPDNLNTIGTIRYSSSKNKLFATRILPSEHTLKWLDENFGPGSTNNTLIASDEYEEFFDPVESEANAPIQTEKSDLEKKDIDVVQKSEKLPVQECQLPNDDFISTDFKDILGLDKAENFDDERNINDKIKTVHVLPLKESRRLKTSPDSNEQRLEESNLITSAAHFDNLVRSAQISEEILSLKKKYKGKIQGKTFCDKIESFRSLRSLTAKNSDDKKDDGIQEVKNVSEITQTKIVKTEEINRYRNTGRSFDAKYDTDQTKLREGCLESGGTVFENEYTTNLKLQNENILGILRDQEKRNLVQTNESLVFHKHDIRQDIENLERSDEKKIVLKLNDKVLEIDNHSINNRNFNSDKNKYKKPTLEDIKKRHEELEKDYIMTRLELALNTNIIKKPEMAKYILEKSQEMIKDVMDKTNENITLKLQTNLDARKSSEDEKSIEILKEINSRCSDFKHIKNVVSPKVFKTEIYENQPHCVPDLIKTYNNNLTMIKHLEIENSYDNHLKGEKGSSEMNQKDLNNISKIKNVKIYRKDSKINIAGGYNVASISINSIDNIMKNKNLLIEEIKGYKREMK